MSTHITSMRPAATAGALFSGADWFDPLEGAVRSRVRSFVEETLKAELDAALSRKRYERYGISAELAPRASYSLPFHSKSLAGNRGGDT